MQRTSQKGFTLVELMVGVVLGLLTVLVITQVTVQAESRRRAVSMGSDAQINGSLALFSLQRDIQMAGYGALSSPDALGCTILTQFNAASTTYSYTLAPVVITDGASGAPDTVQVMLARTRGSSVPIKITENHTQTGNNFVVASSLGVSAGDLMIAVPKTQSAATNCAVFSVQADTSSASTTLSATRIPHVSTSTSKWNVNTIFPAAGYAKDDYLLNMGSMVLRAYTVSATNELVAMEVSTTTGTQDTRPFYPQIVNLQAMYGKDTSGDGVIDLYDNTTPTTAADWQKVQNIRLAVVARSAHYEKDAVTTSAPTWDVGASVTVSGTSTADCNSGSKCITLKVNQDTDWQHYRYKVYETIVPLRNVLWNS